MRRTISIVGVTVMLAVAWAVPVAHAQSRLALGPDILFDEPTGRLYLSIVPERRVLAIDVDTTEVVQEYFVPGEPAGMDLASDGKELYVALNDAGSLHIINLVTGASQTIVATQTLETAHAFDVLEIGDGRILLTGSPGSSGIAYVVLIDLNDGSQTRVASNAIIRESPRLVRAGPDSVLVTEGFSPNSLYRLDLTDPTLPIIAQDDHGAVQGTYYAASSPDGLRAYLTNQIIRTSDMAVVGSPPVPGVPLVSADGTTLFSAGDENVTVIDLETMRVVNAFPIEPACGDNESFLAGYGALGIRAVALDESAKMLYTLHTDRVCVTPLLPRCNDLVATHDMTGLGVTALTGTNGDDVIVGTDGADTIDGLGGNDTICAGAGNDVVVGGAGDDALAGGAGDDVMRGNEGHDIVLGQDGNDRLLGGTGDDLLVGGAGNDYLGGFGGADFIEGGPGDDVIFGGFGGDTIFGDSGKDRIHGLIGDDSIDGGLGNDDLSGDRGNDSIDGGEGDDVVRGGNANDVVMGGDGDDDVSGGKADDQLSGGLGVDSCSGNQSVVGDTADASCEFVFSVP